MLHPELVFFNSNRSLDRSVPHGAAERALLRLAASLAGGGRKITIVAPPPIPSHLFPGVRFIGMQAVSELPQIFARLHAERRPYHLVSSTCGDVLVASMGEPMVVSRTLWLHKTDCSRLGAAVGELSEAADRFIYVSNAQRRFYESAGFPAAKGVHVPNAVDAEVFSPPQEGSERRRMLCFAGACVPEKGLDLLFEAFRLLRGMDSEVTLEIFGSESMWQRQGLYDWEGLQRGQRALRVHGFVPAERVSEAFRSAALVVIPTLKSKIAEASGLCSIEAQACGCPVLVSDSGGLPETVRNGETGLVVDSEDPSEWSQVIWGLLKRANRLRSLGEAGPRFVGESFSAEKQLAAFEGVFSSLQTS